MMSWVQILHIHGKLAIHLYTCKPSYGMGSLEDHLDGPASLAEKNGMLPGQ